MLKIVFSLLCSLFCSGMTTSTHSCSVLAHPKVMKHPQLDSIRTAKSTCIALVGDDVDE